MTRPSPKCARLCAKYRNAMDRHRCLAKCHPGCRYAGVSMRSTGLPAHVWICPQRPKLKVERVRRSR